MYNCLKPTAMCINYNVHILVQYFNKYNKLFVELVLTWLCISFNSMLVNIYGSKDLFVSEYRTLLADRILSSFNYDTEKEVNTHKIMLSMLKQSEC